MASEYFGTLVALFPSNLGIRKAQRRIHGDARRLGRRSSSGFPPLAPTRISFEPGTSAVTRVSKRGPSAEIFTLISMTDLSFETQADPVVRSS
jgi:hypothetical protein